MPTKNIGTVDRIFRFILVIMMILIGLIYLDGLNGSYLGLGVVFFTLLPIYMIITRSCIIYKWLNIHSLSHKECEQFGNPKKKSKQVNQ